MKKDLFANIVGQETAKRSIYDWYIQNEPQPLLIYGPSGYGKTNFATSLGAIPIDTTQMRSDRESSILKPIKRAQDGDLLFFDEIHSLQPKTLEGLYNIIDTNTFYDKELCQDLELPKVRFIFATNLLDKLPVAFVNRCRMVTLEDYTDEELQKIIHNKYSNISKEALPLITKAAKGVPRTALSLAKSIISGATTDGIEGTISKDEVSYLLNSRFKINSDTGLSEKEFLVVQRVADREHLSITAIANLLKISVKDAQNQYINPLRSSEWLAVSSRGVVLGYKGHENFRLFVKSLR